MQTSAKGLEVGLSGHWALPVAMTAVVWSAATSNVGLGDYGFQRHRTGSFDRVGCRLPASASEPITRNPGILVHNMANDRHGAFHLKAIVPVRVARLLLMPGLVALPHTGRPRSTAPGREQNVAHKSTLRACRSPEMAKSCREGTAHG